LSEKRFKNYLSIIFINGGDYFNLRLVYIGKESDTNNNNLLMYSQAPYGRGVSATQLDVVAGWALSEIRKHKTYPRMLKIFGRKVRNMGFPLIGKVVDKGTVNDQNYVEVWVPDKAGLPQWVEAEPHDLPIFSSPPKERDGVFGGLCRINPGKRTVTGTLITHGYRYPSGRFEISMYSPFAKAFEG
jgi:hypothetical protein